MDAPLYRLECEGFVSTMYYDKQEGLFYGMLDTVTDEIVSFSGTSKEEAGDAFYNAVTEFINGGTY